jgi:hypothetical protein
MATTTNYGWGTPDDTDLVKDGALAIRDLGQDIDTTTKALNPETTTGDIAYRSATANTNTRLALGTAGQVLQVNSGATAPEWATLAGGGGKVLQVVSTLKTDTFTSTSTSFTDITGLSVSITPSSATSKVLILSSFMLSGTNGLYLVTAKLLRGATTVYAGDADGSRTQGFYNNIPADNNGGGFGNITFLDSPATTSATTYKIQGFGTVSGGVTAWYLNRTANDNNNSSGLRGVSSIIAMEIGA